MSEWLSHGGCCAALYAIYCPMSEWHHGRAAAAVAAAAAALISLTFSAHKISKQRSASSLFKGMCNTYLLFPLFHDGFVFVDY
jgi:hypothetical protein